MLENIDISKADVAILNQNQEKIEKIRLKITKSFDRLTTDTLKANINIISLLRDVNKLNKNNQLIDAGIRILNNVNENAVIMNEYEKILSKPVETVGSKKYIEILVLSKNLHEKIQHKIKRFTGVLGNFEKLIEKSDEKLEDFLSIFLNQGPETILEDSTKINEIKTIFVYFKNVPEKVETMYICARTQNLKKSIEEIGNTVYPIKIEKTGYEKGKNGLIKFINKLVSSITFEIQLIEALEESMPIIPLADIMNNIIDKSINDFFINKVLSEYQKFFNLQTTLINHDMLLFEIIESFYNIQNLLTKHGLSFDNFKNFMNEFIVKSSVIFKEYIKMVDNRFTFFFKSSDNTLSTIIVEIISLMRKICEFNTALLLLIKNYKLGEWLLTKPAPKFINVYTSMIPNAEISKQADFLLSSFFSDVIDSLMINVELELKNNNDISSKKSTQGFYLIKNIIMIETIINRSSKFHSSLGTHGLKRIEKLKNRFLMLFLDDWNYASYIIIRFMNNLALNPSSSATSQSTQVKNSSSTSLKNHLINSSSDIPLSSKEKEQIKDLFRSFNESFEDALKNYGKYNITDQNMHLYLSSEIKKLIINAYSKLYDKYGNVDFSKNKSKYVKYNKQQFEKLLNDKL